MWCKRVDNPHPDYKNETIPTKVFVSEKGRKIELCLSCFESEHNLAKVGVESSNLFTRSNFSNKLERISSK